jgi:hypothetical protein
VKFFLHNWDRFLFSMKDNGSLAIRSNNIGFTFLLKMFESYLSVRRLLKQTLNCYFFIMGN